MDQVWIEYGSSMDRVWNGYKIPQGGYLFLVQFERICVRNLDHEFQIVW